MPPAPKKPLSRADVLPAEATVSHSTHISNLAPLMTRYRVAVEINGRTVAEGEAFSAAAAERNALLAYLALKDAFGDGWEVKSA